MSGYFKWFAQATFKSGLASHFSRQAISAVTPAASLPKDGAWRMGRGKAFQSLGANTMKALSPDEVF